MSICTTSIGHVGPFYPAYNRKPQRVDENMAFAAFDSFVTIEAPGRHCHGGRCDPDDVPANSYRGYRFPKEIISQCVWLYFNLSVSLREVELMMAYGGI